jgi:hypothetical protein
VNGHRGKSSYSDRISNLVSAASRPRVWPQTFCAGEPQLDNRRVIIGRTNVTRPIRNAVDVSLFRLATELILLTVDFRWEEKSLVLSP